MSFEKAKADLEEKGLGDHVIVLNESSATVAEAAHALGVEPASIAKTLSAGPFLFAFRLLADIHPALGNDEHRLFALQNRQRFGSAGRLYAQRVSCLCHGC